jgi:DNA modification methylase
MTVRILSGDCRDSMATLPEQSVHCCVTSPPYFGLRDYGHEGQIGLEDTPDAYVQQLVEVFRAVRRVLRDDGTLWLNLGDSYANSGGSGGARTRGGLAAAAQKADGKPRNPDNRADKDGALFAAYRPSTVGNGIKPKDLIGIPWRVAFALQADGWYLRQDIIWHKPNPMPESVTDRCTKAHEYVFLLSKGPRYWFDGEAIAEAAACPEGPGNTKPYEVAGQRAGANANLGGGVHKIGPRETRNKRSVWTIATQPFAEAHFATMAPELAETCIAAGCPLGGTVLDPFGGAGTTGLVADRMQRDAVLCELNPEYIQIAKRRIHGDAPLFADVEVAA